MNIEEEVRQIVRRNHRVEGDKAWETSWMRLFVVLVFTYIVAYAFMWITGLGNPWWGAFVPAIGFFLSTLSIPPLKKWWLKRFYGNRNS